MKKFFAGFAIVALSACVAHAFDETERVSRTVAFAPGGEVRVMTFSGRVAITGSDANEVTVEAVRHGSRDRLDRIKLDIQTSGSLVTIDANHRDSSWFPFRHDTVVDTDLDIKVPRHTDLRVNTFSAPVTIEHVQGSHDVHGFSSRVRLTDVSGPVQAKTFSGSVEIRVSEWQDRQSIDVNTFSGGVELEVPPEARGHVTFNSFSGRLDSELPLTLRSASRRSVSGELGSGDAGLSMRFRTFSGNVRILR